jgi:hypothetical protein
MASRRDWLSERVRKAEELPKERSLDEVLVWVCRPVPLVSWRELVFPELLQEPGSMPGRVR